MRGLLIGLYLMAGLHAELLGQMLQGAWQLHQPSGAVATKIFAGPYFMVGVRSREGAFISAAGGTYAVNNNQYTETYDFFTADSSKVGTSKTFSILIQDNQIVVTDEQDRGQEQWVRADEGQTVLTGAWRFGARVDEHGKVGERRSPASPRQTIKVLSGKHFQWAAFNRQTGQFMGTGGGTYVLVGDQYTENIHFFSRDNSRVGMSLTFDFRLEGDDWFHKGKGTTGNLVSEVWERLR